MWPFRTKAAPPKRVTPSIPFVDSTAWSAGGLTDAYVSPAAAEALAAVLCAVEIISGTIANLPAEVLKTDEAGTPAPEHPLQRLIDGSPNPRETWSDMLATFVASALLRGNGLLEARWNDRGRLVELSTAPWSAVTCWTDDQGVPFFDYVPAHGPGSGEKRTLLRDEVCWLKDRSDGGVVGISRLQRAGTSMQMNIETLRTTRQWQINSPRPAGALETPGKVSPEDAKRLAEDWTSAYSGARTGKPAVLSGGLQWKSFDLFSAADQQLVERLRWTVEDVSRIFQIPPSFLGDSTRATYASAREATNHLARHTLLPWVMKIQRAFAASILGSGYRLHLDIASLLKSDFDAYASALSKYRQSGILSPNDARAELGYPASTEPGADSLAPPAAASAKASEQDGDDPPVPAKLIDLEGRRHG